MIFFEFNVLFIIIGLRGVLLSLSFAPCTRSSEASSDHASAEEDCGCGTGSALTRESAIVDGISSRVSAVNIGATTKDAVGALVADMNSKMVIIPGGLNRVGTDAAILKEDGESPSRLVKLSPFLMDIYETTNNDFREFVQATSYITESENFGWSFVFQTAIPDEVQKDIHVGVLGAEWWLPVNGSNWMFPEAPGEGRDVFSTGRGEHPVIQVSWNDAVAFCAWRGARLPTEAEWEFAAKGPSTIEVPGRSKAGNPSLFPWGNKMMPNGRHRMNIFQGRFPLRNDVEDGYEFTCPGNAFPPQNEYGLYNMIGNVWEWVEDWYTTDHPTEDLLVDPTGPPSGTDKVKKGGSFLCHRSFCYRYRNVARFPSTPDSATYNIGFRCAMNADDETIARHNASLIKSSNKAHEHEQEVDREEL